MGMLDFIRKRKKCVCSALPAHPTSQDYNVRYLSMLRCPVHAGGPRKETRRYEAGKGRLRIRAQRGVIYSPAFVVMQAVCLGRDGQVGIKAFDTPHGWRAISSFPTAGDARAYLMGVIDTVRSEQKLGVRTRRNLDPRFAGGLDFCIVKAAIAVPTAPLRGRGWKLPRKGRKNAGRAKKS